MVLNSNPWQALEAQMEELTGVFHSDAGQSHPCPQHFLEGYKGKGATAYGHISMGRCPASSLPPAAQHLKSLGPQGVFFGDQIGSETSLRSLPALKFSQASSDLV